MNTQQQEINQMMMEQQRLEKIREDFKEQLKEKFDADKFKEDYEKGVDISPQDIKKYIKKEDDDDLKISDNGQDTYGNKDLQFQTHFEKGMYIAKGSNGHVIQSKNLDDLHRQLAKVFKLHALKNHQEAQVFIHLSSDPKSKAYKKTSESFVKNFIKEGVAVGGDIPKDPKFWKETKEDFLSQEGRTKAEWDRLTQYVPKEYMQEKEEKSQSKSSESISPVMMQRLKAQGRL